MTSIGDILIQARHDAGLSQRELGQRLHLAQQQIARWEREGYRCVSLGKLDAVADVLGLTLAAGQATPMAAETPAAYSTATTGPVRDLGGIAARIRTHATRLQQEYGLTRVGVYGSFARGEQHSGSDVDVVVELERPTMGDLFGLERELAGILGRDVEAGSLASINPRLRSAVERELVDVWRSR